MVLMSLPLLATKLFAPRVHHNLVPRSHLVELLNAGLKCPLTLVSTPAGYGKTTLVSTWLSEVNIPSAWLLLDESDNDPSHFFQYFITALQSVIPTIGVDLLNMLQGMQPVPFSILTNLLINEIAEHETPFVFVLDDFHVIHSQSILEMLTLLIEHEPPQMHLVLLSRTDPHLPLSRLRGRNQLVEIRASQLRFTRYEIAVFLNEVMGLNLSPNDLAAMETRTEGWIAGLQLAATSMQGSKDTHDFVTAFAGSHHYIMDYLVDEVLSVQPERVRSFLIQTSILDRMCGSLCNVVLEADGMERVDGQEILETLEQNNLFVIPLDDERHWYRYHHLFADVLNRYLEKLFPHRLSELHSRASRWHEQNGFVSEAIQHALMAGNQNHATQLIEQNGGPLLMRGEAVTLLKWIEAVEFHEYARPWLAILKAWALILSKHYDQVEQSLLAAEDLVSSLASRSTIKIRMMLGSLTAARAQWSNMEGKTSLAADFARQALNYLPDTTPFSCNIRCVATSILGDASWMNGDLEEAIEAYTDAVRLSRLADNIHLAIIASSHLAEILTEQGHLRQGNRTFLESLQMTTQPNRPMSPLADGVYAGLSQISYEWNDLGTATQQIDQSIALSQKWGNIDLLAVGYVMLAWLEHVQGHPERVREAIRNVERLENEHTLLPRYSSWVKYSLARLWIAQGNLEKASYLALQSGITVDDEIPYLCEPEYFLWLRVFLAQGNYDAALALNQRLLQKAEVTKRTGRVIELLVLQALIFRGKKDIDQALAVLDRALSLAQPEGYVRAFLDEGEPMAKLLYLAKSRRSETGYATVLLSAMGEAADKAELSTQLLIELLSMREMEVLKLIEAGYSNQEIATKLVISIATVKRHISNLYTKLGAQSRTQAVALGKELRLFE